MSTASLQSSVDETKFLIDGHYTNPWAATINLGPISGSSQDGIIEIGKVLLSHELFEAGVDHDEDSLLDFVRRDIELHSQVALKAYLGIVRHARFPIRQSFLARLFGKRQSQPTAMWEWRSVRSVEETTSSIKICGRIINRG